jgi:hypothetical protein
MGGGSRGGGRGGGSGHASSSNGENAKINSSSKEHGAERVSGTRAAESKSASTEQPKKEMTLTERIKERQDKARELINDKSKNPPNLRNLPQHEYDQRLQRANNIYMRNQQENEMNRGDKYKTVDERSRNQIFEDVVNKEIRRSGYKELVRRYGEDSAKRIVQKHAK